MRRPTLAVVPRQPAGVLRLEDRMSLVALLLVLAVVAFVLGFIIAAKWLFIVAAILLIVGLFSGFGARGRSRTW
jgi:uncharacterized membrane protein